MPIPISLCCLILSIAPLPAYIPFLFYGVWFVAARHFHCRGKQVNASTGAVAAVAAVAVAVAVAVEVEVAVAVAVTIAAPLVSKPEQPTTPEHGGSSDNDITHCLHHAHCQAKEAPQAGRSACSATGIAIFSPNSWSSWGRCNAAAATACSIPDTKQTEAREAAGWFCSSSSSSSWWWWYFCSAKAWLETVASRGRSAAAVPAFVGVVW